MTTKSLKIIFALIMIGALNFNLLAYAQTATPVGTSTQGTTENFCNPLQKKVDEKFTQFSTHEKEDIIKYNELFNKIRAFIQKRQNEGYATSRLKSYANTMQAKIGQFRADITAYVGNLKDAKDSSCSDTGGKFKETLQKARENLKKVHDDVQAIKDYYDQTLRPELLKQVKLNGNPSQTQSGTK